MSDPADIGGLIVPKMIAQWIPVSAEYLRGPTDEERTEWARRAREHRTELDAQIDAHRAAVGAASGLTRAVIILHAPVLYRDELVCRGCDSIGNDYDDEPGWPCRTYRLCTS